MNIFWFDRSLSVNAQQHCDKHIVKMPLELAQMLSCAHHVHNSGNAQHVYKPTHRHHPCTVWVSQSSSNYNLTLDLFVELLAEYTHRYGKFHKSGDIHHFLEECPCPAGELTNIPLAMPDEYKCSCPITSYRNYFNGEKQHIARWSKRPTPEWYNADS